MKMPEPFIHYRHYDEQVQPFADENTVPLYDKQALIDLLEAAAITAWTHYMGACKKAGINPAMQGQFLAASAIRKLKEKL
jgi:hypothetical protein